MEDRQNERPKHAGEAQTETGAMLKGPKPHGLSQEQEKEVVSKGSPGEERTPDKPIGQVAHADDRADGGAGKPQTSRLEPEKQGGIGGP
jgi:hypothetical protein